MVNARNVNLKDIIHLKERIKHDLHLQSVSANSLKLSNAKLFQDLDEWLFSRLGYFV